jgi:glycosyltransferase involved in cell wall biosynthesis
MGDPLVSVVIPTYNRADALPASVRSVLGQTVGDLEVIVVDDGSTDHTPVVLRDLGDERVRHTRLPENRGANAARNAGIEQARGRYIAFQDSDDEWLSSKLEKQLSTTEMLPHGVGIVYCKYQRVHEGVPGRVFGEPFERELLLQRNFIGTPTLLAHRQCLQTVRFDEKLRRRQDWELCLRLMQKCEFAFVDEVLVLSHVSPQSITGDRRLLLEAQKYILEKHGDLVQTSPRALAGFHYRIGALSADVDDWQAARMHLLQAVRRWPLEPRYWTRAVAACAGRSVYARLFEISAVGHA